MKKFFAILLSAALLVSMFVVFAPANAEPVNAALTATVDATATNQGSNGYQGDLNDGEYATDLTDYAGNTGWFAYTACWSLEQYLDPINTVKVDDTYSLGTASLVLDDSYNVTEVKIHVAGGDRWEGDVFTTPTFIKVYASTDNGATWGSAVEADLSAVVAGGNLVSAAVNAEANAIKVEFGVTNESRVLISEIEVWGTVVEEASSSSSSVASSSEVPSSEVPSSEVPSSEAPSSEAPSSSAPAASLEDQLKELVGEDVADPYFDVVINAPETYVPGESITVQVTIANVQAISPEWVLDEATDEYVLSGADLYLHAFESRFFYDNSVLTLTNSVKNGILQAFDEKAEAHDSFENWCKIIGDNEIEISALSTEIAAEYSKKDGELVFELTFDVSADATGDLGFYITTESIEGWANSEEGDPFGTTYVLGNGSYDIISEYEAPASSSSEAPSSEAPSSSVAESSSEAPTPVEPGDASVGFVVFAILAVVAIAGSAVVIKSRR